MSSRVASPPATEQPDMIPLRRGCKRIGKSLTWCYESARTQSFVVPVYRLGSRWVISRIALEEILNKQHAA